MTKDLKKGSLATKEGRRDLIKIECLDSLLNKNIKLQTLS
jgi:hypothetical protein